jgi:hypothetical protein
LHAEKLFLSSSNIILQVDIQLAVFCSGKKEPFYPDPILAQGDGVQGELFFRSITEELKTMREKIMGRTVQK